MSLHKPLSAGAAPGKVILFGEHSVVYGQPAIAAALGHGLGASVQESDEGPWLKIPRWGSDGLTVRPIHGGGGDAMQRAFALALHRCGLNVQSQLDVTIDGQLPLGVGLGSSAAFAVALLRGLMAYSGHPLDETSLMSAAADIEAIFHGNPSGLDHSVVVTGRCLIFERDREPNYDFVRLQKSIPLVIGWAPREGTTREAVEQVRRRHTEHPQDYEHLFGSMGRVAREAVPALEAGDLLRLGALFDVNHGLLNACGVSSLANEEMVLIARGAGALGAKLTGAGRGGAVIALAQNNGDEIVTALRQAGYDALSTEILPYPG